MYFLGHTILGVIESDRTRDHCYAMRYIVHYFVTSTKVTLINSKLFFKVIIPSTGSAVIYLN
jgi:hypothetical protein